MSRASFARWDRAAIICAAPFDTHDAAVRFPPLQGAVVVADASPPFVLLLTDTADDVAPLRALLGTAGMHVETADCAGAARAFLVYRAPDLIVAGLRLWGMVTGRVLALLDASDKTTGVPVVLVADREGDLAAAAPLLQRPSTALVSVSEIGRHLLPTARRLLDHSC